MSCHLHSVLAVGVQAVKFELTSDHLSHVVAVSSSSSTANSDVGRKVVDLVAVLVANHGAASSASISCNRNTVLHHFWLKLV